MADKDGLFAGVRVGVAQRVIASYPNYPAAAAVVSSLTTDGFPADRTMIVGRGSRFAGPVTGRMSPVGMILRTAASGAVTGALVGWLLVVLWLVDPQVGLPWVAVNAAVLGGTVGAVLGLLGYAVTRGRRKVTANAVLAADAYDILVDADLADDGVRRVSGSTGEAGQHDAPEPSSTSDRPRGGHEVPAALAR